jgi:hypothetical protein
MLSVRCGLVWLIVAAAAVAPSAAQARGYGGLSRLRQQAQAQAKAAAQYQQALVQQAIAAEQARAQAEADRKTKLAAGHAAAKSVEEKRREANRRYAKTHHASGFVTLTPAPTAEVKELRAKNMGEPVVAPRPVPLVRK